MPIANREADRMAAAATAIAPANGGHHNIIVAHLSYDPAASEAFVETHVRRLEAMRRLTGAVERAVKGSRIITEHHLDPAGPLSVLPRREPLRVAGQLSDELDRRFVEAVPRMRVEGVFRRAAYLTSGRFTLIEKSCEFPLAMWRPVLDRHAGRMVSGLTRGDADSRTIGWGRTGPGIS